MKDHSRLFQFIFFIGLFLYVLIQLQVNTESYAEVDNPVKEWSRASDSANTYQRAWMDYDRGFYDLRYEVLRQDYRDSKRMKAGLAQPNYKHIPLYQWYWGSVYRAVLENEKEFIHEISDSLKVIKEEKRLNRSEFADVIVSFIQDIPYSYVFDGESCDTTDIPCINGQRFGIHTPTEFLYTLKGDCDTRSIILYGILKRFGYDPRIVVSAAYGHAMIMLGQHSSGSYMTFQGKKYYFWETTYTGWKKGVLPPSCSDINKWHIAL